MPVYNPAVDVQGKVKRSMTKELSAIPLREIINKNASSSFNAVDIIRDNGLEAFVTAITEGYTWNNIANHLGVTVGGLRSNWYQKLNSDEKALIQWAETEHAKKLTPHLISKMIEIMNSDPAARAQAIADDNLEPLDAVERLEVEKSIIGMMDKKVQMIQRIATVSAKFISAQSSGSDSNKGGNTEVHVTNMVVSNEWLNALPDE